MIMVCPECSTPFERCRSAVKKSKTSFCSSECYHRHNKLSEEEVEKRARLRCKKWRDANKERCLSNQRKWNSENKKKKQERDKKWYKKNQSSQRDRSRVYNKKNIGGLQDSYIKRQLKKQTGLEIENIPQSLVEAKREQLKLHRLIHERQ